MEYAHFLKADGLGNGDQSYGIGGAPGTFGGVRDARPHIPPIGFDTRRRMGGHQTLLLPPTLL